MTDTPLVSIYVPTRDRLHLLRRAVDSVLAQDHANVEVIVVDDGSSDGTAEYLRAKAAEDPRLKFHVNERNLGACRSRNIAIGLARGEFITGLDDDDYFLPTHVSSLLASWPRRRQGVVALFPHALVIGANGAVTPRRRGKPGRRVERHKALLATNRIGNQLFLKREDLLAIGGFDPEFPAWQDLECWYRLLQRGGAAQGSGAHTYVVDEGHELERITTGAPHRISDAYQRFAAKHRLSWLEGQLLYANYRVCVLAFRLEGRAMALAWRAYHFAIRLVF